MSQSKVAQIVSSASIFESLDKSDMDRLIESGHLRAFGPGQVLLREGETKGDLFIIDSGSVEIKIKTPKGNVTLAELGAHTIIGEVPATTGVKRTSTATATTMVNAVVLPGELVKEIADANPTVHILLEELIEKRAMDTISKL
jgi:CRP-like cAMP-binding protein